MARYDLFFFKRSCYPSAGLCPPAAPIGAQLNYAHIHMLFILVLVLVFLGRSKLFLKKRRTRDMYVTRRNLLTYVSTHVTVLTPDTAGRGPGPGTYDAVSG